MPKGNRKAMCGGCGLARTESGGGLCAACRGDPDAAARRRRVDEYAEALAWAMDKFGINTEESHDGIGVVGAAKVKIALARLEAAAAGLPLPEGVWGGGGGGRAGVPGVPDDGREEGGQGRAAVHAGGLAAGDAAVGAVQGPRGQAAAGVGEDAEGDRDDDGGDGRLPATAGGRSVGPVGGGRRSLVAVQEVARRQGALDRLGRRTLFPVAWPFAALFTIDQRVTTPHGDGVVVNADGRDGWLVYTVLVAGRYVEVDEDDVDVCEATTQPPRPKRRAGRRRRRANRPYLFAGVE
mgnify:FL=1